MTAHGCLIQSILGGLAESEADYPRVQGAPRARRGARHEGGATLESYRSQEAQGDPRCDHGEETLAEIERSYNVSGCVISD